MRGWAQRCGRALRKLKTRGVWGVDPALAQVQTLLRSVKEHHLFAKGKQAKRQVLTRLLTEVGQLVVHTRPLLRRLGDSCDRVTQRATATLGAMHEVAKRLVPQIVQWITTGIVAQGKIIHAGLPQARAIVRNKAGKKVEFGLPYLLSRLGGGYVFGTLLRGTVDESKMPWQALAGYRALFGAHATPTLLVYDRGGYATATLTALANEGVQELGIQPKGQGVWHVAEVIRETVRSERGKTEGIHWHPEDRNIWLQQAQGTSVADAGDGRASVYPRLHSQQTDAGPHTGRQVRGQGMGTERTDSPATIARQEGSPEAPITFKRVLRHALFTSVSISPISDVCAM